MSNLEKAIERIRILECPTGDVESRVAGILQDYNVANRDEVIIQRNEHLDKDGAEAYSVNLLGKDGYRIAILARSGLDDYVAKVIDAYIIQ